MIKASDLRIGNYVSYENEDNDTICEGIHYVEGFYKILIGNHLRPVDQCYPIPITEEWLLKFGFQLDNENLVADIQKKYYLTLPIEGEADNQMQYRINTGTESFGNYTVEGFWGSNNFKHVHQLQNLYFALTGEELKYQDG